MDALPQSQVAGPSHAGLAQAKALEDGELNQARAAQAGEAAHGGDQAGDAAEPGVAMGQGGVEDTLL